MRRWCRAASSSCSARWSGWSPSARRRASRAWTRLTRKWIDLLIDTEGELRKVSWPTRDDLVNSTTAVLVSIVLLGVFLVGMDYLVSWVMSIVGVLPK